MTHKIINKEKSEWIKKENTHEKIIEEKTFYKVQKLIERKQKNESKSCFNQNTSD